MKDAIQLIPHNAALYDISLSGKSQNALRT
jgi:hypothetical protein